MIVIMGVCGSGKSTIGKNLSQALQADFLEGDDFHSRKNVDKMASGTPLTNTDRIAWINAMTDKIKSTPAQRIVLSCSALNPFVRDRLSHGSARPIHWVYLKVSRDELIRRLRARENHFMKETMIDSQLEAMDPPRDAIVINGDLNPEDILSNILPHFTQ